MKEIYRKNDRGIALVLFFGYLNLMKEIYRKNDRGIALVLLKYHVSNQHLFETFATCGCNIRNFDQQVENNDGRDIKVFVSGIWRNIRKLRKLDYVDKVIFESDRKQLLIEATS